MKPTPEMIEAGKKVLGDGVFYAVTAERVWAAMYAAMPKQEPVATASRCCGILRWGKCAPGVVHAWGCRDRNGGELGETLYLYAAPVRELSDEAIEAFIGPSGAVCTKRELVEFARAILAAARGKQ